MTDSRSTKPFSLRLTLEERAHIENEAAGVPLGSYIRSKVLSEPPVVRLRRSGLALVDRQSFAQLLARLGASRLAGNLNQLAHLANVGALPFSPEIEAELRGALAEIREMRRLLLTALGLKGDDAP